MRGSADQPNNTGPAIEASPQSCSDSAPVSLSSGYPFVIEPCDDPQPPENSEVKAVDSIESVEQVDVPYDNISQKLKEYFQNFSVNTDLRILKNIDKKNKTIKKAFKCLSTLEDQDLITQKSKDFLKNLNDNNNNFNPKDFFNLIWRFSSVFNLAKLHNHKELGKFLDRLQKLHEVALGNSSLKQDLLSFMESAILTYAAQGRDQGKKESFCDFVFSLHKYYDLEDNFSSEEFDQCADENDFFDLHLQKTFGLLREFSFGLIALIEDREFDVKDHAENFFILLEENKVSTQNYQVLLNCEKKAKLMFDKISDTGCNYSDKIQAIKDFKTSLAPLKKTSKGLFVAGAVLLVAVASIIVGSFVVGGLFSSGIIPAFTFFIVAGVSGSGGGFAACKFFQQTLFGSGHALANRCERFACAYEAPQPVGGLAIINCRQSNF